MGGETGPGRQAAGAPAGERPGHPPAAPVLLAAGRGGRGARVDGRSVQLGVRARGLIKEPTLSDHAAAAHLETSTGLDSRKLAIWTFIGSECLFFATLISNYLVHKETWLSGPGPFPHDVWKSPSGQVFEPIIEIRLVTVGTALLLFSSLFVVLALANAQRGNRTGLLAWLAATLMCGFFFVGMQVYEFTHFVHKGLTFKTNLFGAWIAPEKSLNLEIAALYWHFVDVVWIVIFPVVYLIK